LDAFSGTVVFVSHDRYFIDRLATRVLEVEGGTITSYEGNYEDYLRRKELLAAGAAAMGSAVQNLKVEAAALAPALAATNGNADPEAEKERPKRLNPIRQKQMEDRCIFLEEEIPRIEAAIAHTEEQLGVYVSAAETQRLSTLTEELRSQLTALTAEWEELMLQLEGA